MNSIVIYGSRHGNTHKIAEAIASELRRHGTAHLFAIDEAPSALTKADLIVVGGPTHAHGMSRRSTRQAAAEAANKPGSGLELDADAMGPGLREWFDEVGDRKAATAAAFDTRVDMPRALTGSAGRGIERRLRHSGFEVVTTSESFFVEKHNRLLDGEEQRAATWGKALAATAMRRLQVEAGTSGTGS